MSRLIPARYINPHALTGVRARGPIRRLRNYIGEPCPYCGFEMIGPAQSERAPSRDHKIPVSRINHPFAKSGGAFLGGGNVHVCCRGCNSDKGSLDHEEYLAVLAGLASRLDKGPRPAFQLDKAIMDEIPA